MITDGLLAYDSELYFHAAIAGIMVIVLLVGFFAGRASVTRWMRKHLDAESREIIAHLDAQLAETTTRLEYVTADNKRLTEDNSLLSATISRMRKVLDD